MARKLRGAQRPVDDRNDANVGFFFLFSLKINFLLLRECNIEEKITTVRRDIGQEKNSPAEKSAQLVVTPVLSSRRRWLFRLTAVVLFPWVGLPDLRNDSEHCRLWLSDEFLLQMQMGNQSVFVENEKFGLRFFPPALARSPSPVMLAAEKPAGTYRIFLSESRPPLAILVPPMESGVTWKSCCASVFRERILKSFVWAGRLRNRTHTTHLPMAQCALRHEGDLWILHGKQ